MKKTLYYYSGISKIPELSYPQFVSGYVECPEGYTTDVVIGLIYSNIAEKNNSHFHADSFLKLEAQAAKAYHITLIFTAE